MPYGASFRSGSGISGRTFSMLQSDEERFLSAYFLLASLPGGMLIPYGDEYGVENIPLSDLPEHLQADTRNINRGALSGDEGTTDRGRRLMPSLSGILRKREALREYVNVWPTRLPSPPGVFAATYRHGTSELLAYVNITGEPHEAALGDGAAEDFRNLLTLGGADATGGTVRLGPYACIWLER
jgi:hypothetical protein